MTNDDKSFSAKVCLMDNDVDSATTNTRSKRLHIRVMDENACHSLIILEDFGNSEQADKDVG